MSRYMHFDESRSGPYTLDEHSLNENDVYLHAEDANDIDDIELETDAGDNDQGETPELREEVENVQSQDIPGVANGILKPQETTGV